ncbi:glycosyltransferase family 2 protein [Chitinophaga sp. XS-30]|uniref:glycosyltransferase n=1 Tax=Chitinophaga sp. XS-30 TaxID=2604421 RepID=UPI0011DD6DFF|nr:glycosyltransferase family 2 protein [Chitinophaga sp. XS-30]QEH42589.1 glycosyltransferase family 2 protein [Chitinophaga sp. XS-30]
MSVIIEAIIFTYLAGCVLFNLIFAIAGSVKRRKKTELLTEATYGRIVILVPAYKEDSIILSTATSYAALNYPEDKYELVVIADSLQPETLTSLEASGIRAISVSFDKSTKARSLNAAFAQLQKEYDIALICDADNVLEPDFLLKINKAYQNGEYVIQAQRVAKNLDTPFAVLDAANEIIANHIYRKGANSLGLSSSVIGSGMAFHFPLIRDIMKEIDATGGFDKVLQLLVVSRGYSIYYLEDAHIFDEKVESSATFSNQRKRWMSSQFVYLRTYWTRGWKALFRGNLDYFNLAVCQNLLLPRMLLLAALLGGTFIYLLLFRYLEIPLTWWLAALVLNGVSLLLPIPRKFFSKYLLTAMLSLPRAMGIMVLLLFRLKGANKTFIHTKHTKTAIDNPLLNATRE